jgi:apolipoprotein N-acyltransferase
MRAIVTGRTVVAISTVGLSGIYTPDGKVLRELPMFTPAAMVANISLRSDRTPAVIYGRYIEASAFGFGIGAFLIAVIGLIVARVRRKS